MSDSILRLVIGACIGLAAWLLWLLAAAFVLSRTEDPGRYVLPAALTVLALAALVGGFAAKKLSGLPPLAAGLAGAVTLLIAVTALSTAPDVTSERSGILKAAVFAVCAVFSMFGAMLGGKKNQRVQTKRRRIGARQTAHVR